MYRYIGIEDLVASALIESIKHEENIAKDKQDTLNELGKTEKNKRIVYIGDGAYEGMKVCYSIMTFNSNGKYSSWKRYVYFPDTESFDRAIANISPKAKFAYESSDASMRLIIYKYTNNEYMANEVYDDVLQRVKDNGYTLVE